MLELNAVIFDMDGVIVDSEAHWQYIFESMVQKYGKTLSDADKREFYGCSLEKEVEILSRYIYFTNILLLFILFIDISKLSS